MIDQVNPFASSRGLGKSRAKRRNKNPEGYRTRKGSYWLKDKLANCSMREICPDCEDYFECLDEYCKKAYEGTL